MNASYCSTGVKIRSKIPRPFPLQREVDRTFFIPSLTRRRFVPAPVAPSRGHGCRLIASGVFLYFFARTYGKGGQNASEGDEYGKVTVLHSVDRVLPGLIGNAESTSDFPSIQ